MTESRSATYRVEAFNTAVASENRIHDDETARRFGFRGGLVPGVEVYAYMAHMPVACFGRAWLERGGMECRFLKPVYDGHIAAISGDADPAGLTLRVESDGELCAKGHAWLSGTQPKPPSRDSLPTDTPPVRRPQASEASLAPGRALGIEPVTIDADGLARYLFDIRETEEPYTRAGFVHPGQLLRLANAALLENVVLGPWIHISSRVENFGPARLGDRLTLRSRIASNYMHKGHAIVEVDALVVANDAACVAGIHHVAIWRPRQVADAPVAMPPVRS
jgi:hypothetical protein